MVEKGDVIKATEADISGEAVKNKFEVFWLIYVTSCMLVMPLAEVICEAMDRTFAWQAYILSFYGLFGFAAVLIDRKINAKKDKMYLGDFFFYSLLAFMLISWIFSEDESNLTLAYRLNTEYSEWPDHFLAYYSMMYGASRIIGDKYRKIIIYVFVGFGLLEVTVATLQTFDIYLAKCMYTPETNDRLVSYGLTQNVNFYGAIAVLVVALLTGIFIFGRKINLLIYLLGMFAFYTLIACVSRLAWVGFAAIIFFYVVSMIVFRKKTKASIRGRAVRFASICAGFIAVIIIVLCFRSDLITYKIDSSFRQFEEMNEENSFDAFGSKRGLIWKKGLRTVPTHFLTGVGQDNYIYAFISDPEWKQGDYMQQKGHNEYIHTLVTQGVPALINYLALLIYAGITAFNIVIKQQGVRRYTTWIFFGMFAGYTAQALFNSSIINVAFYFWIVIGLMMPIDSQKEIKKIHPIEKLRSLEAKLEKKK